MVEIILGGLMVAANTKCYLYGLKRGQEEGRFRQSWLPSNLAGPLNVVCSGTILLSEGFKHTNDWGVKLEQFIDKEPAAIIFVALGAVLGPVLLFIASGAVPQLLFEKGVDDGIEARKREERNEN